MFSQLVIEKIGYYVYLLQDPRDNTVFYVGKGFGNRVFQHQKGETIGARESDKISKIDEIKTQGYSVKHQIIRHGLSEEVAFEIEASLIDFIGMKNLLNLQSGHYSSDFGIKSSDEIMALYEAEPLNTELPVLLININRGYRRDMTVDDIYQATRMSWVLGKRKNNAKYAISTYRGLTREVFEINDWFSNDVDGKPRWGFNGQIAKEVIRNELRHKDISDLFRRGAANPVKYVNC
ncbi:LEM-3-like GIY-YIG domain-containing protein [Brumicola nitratireducens]|uniref:GIY-YIG domain-containing protein n=1 Tax=Glaciecola nitratireducens (strain JCM 12485 / KCTC 12276 / FR1064) TaxID=1085623 RepID=G4QKZ0_GLANF|nr:hypothetical protein [Glaciecola nitratireducens]AEP29380.1 hypothetical protein GNIT_1256 [Glaciecola nitratireducens FR1064]